MGTKMKLDIGKWANKTTVIICVCVSGPNVLRLNEKKQVVPLSRMSRTLTLLSSIVEHSN